MTDDHHQPQADSDQHIRLYAEFDVASEPGREREAMWLVADALAPLHLEDRQMERVKTAVAETALNAMEHGNHYQAELPVHIQCRATPLMLTVKVQDHGGDSPVPAAVEAPDLMAKLAGEQSPRGWGLFLIRSMVDELLVENDERSHVVTLVWRLGAE